MVVSTSDGTAKVMETVPRGALGDTLALGQGLGMEIVTDGAVVGPNTGLSFVADVRSTLMEVT